MIMEAHLKVGQPGQSNASDVGVGPATDCLVKERELMNIL